MAARGHRWGVARLALVVFAATVLIAGGKKVSTLIQQIGNESKEITPAAKAIQPAKGAQAPLPRAAASGLPYRQAYANPQLNSRLGYVIPPVGYKLRKSAELHETLPTQFVLQDGNRIVTSGPEWRMFHMNGALVATDRLGLGPAVMDAPRKLLYVVNPPGYLAARSLTDGSLPYNFLPSMGSTLVRTFVSRRDRRMIIAGTERPRGAHGEFLAKNSMIESYDLGDPEQADSMAFLTSLERKAALTLPTLTLHVAGLDERLVAATTDRLFLLNWGLAVEGALEGDFEPQSISLDESGRIYMLAQLGKRVELWMLNSSGERLYSFPLAPGADVAHPPIVGYDHTVYLLADNLVVAVGVDGRVKWTKPAKGHAAGAAVDPTDQLLVAEGNTVVVYSATGERSVISTLPEALVTPPILTESGEILVASDRHLYILERESW